jgi:membrane-bound lytic murein transglycosylase A
MQKRDNGWAQACRDTAAINPDSHASIRDFIESRFTPHELSDERGTRSGILTGYYEPLLRGSRQREGPYQFPIYRKPKDMVNVDLSAMYPETRGTRVRGKKEGDRIVPYPTRGEIERSQLLSGQELLWLDDPVEAFFIGVQGSGRVLLPNGETIRVGYADQNGYGYKSIGRYLIDKGELKPNDASMQSIKAWIAMHPHRRDEVLHQNPSMVFFRELPNLASHLGPIGSLGISLTPQRSIAVDPQFVMPGSLVFLNTRVPNPGAAPRDPGTPFAKLVIAQDTGSAITGPHRGYIFFDTGPQAGEVAGRMRSEGQMFVLLPK